MLSQKSLLTVVKNSKTFTLQCDSDSPILDLQSSLYEMLGFCQAVIQQQASAAEAAKTSSPTEETAPITTTDAISSSVTTE